MIYDQFLYIHNIINAYEKYNIGSKKKIQINLVIYKIDMIYDQFLYIRNIINAY